MKARSSSLGESSPRFLVVIVEFFFFLFFFFMKTIRPSMDGLRGMMIHCRNSIEQSVWIDLNCKLSSRIAHDAIVRYLSSSHAPFRNVGRDTRMKLNIDNITSLFFKEFLFRVPAVTRKRIKKNSTRRGVTSKKNASISFFKQRNAPRTLSRYCHVLKMSHASARGRNATYKLQLLNWWMEWNGRHRVIISKGP